MKRVFVSVGEVSGDMHAASLIRSLKARDSELDFFGLGGELIEREGVELIYGLRDLAVTGFWEVAGSILHFRKIYHDTLKIIRERKPDLAILVDYPGMNLRFAAQLKRLGVKVAYFIVPQVWAWRSGRIKLIEDRVDLLLSILPFECELFDSRKLRCEFVGHPLIDHLRENSSDVPFRQQHGISDQRKIIGLLPGSRSMEVSRGYQIMLETVKQLSKSNHDFLPVTLIRNELDSDLYRVPEELFEVKPMHISAGGYNMLMAADVSIVTSGTATLEAALCGTPFCVVYKTNWLSYRIARSVLKVKNCGLVNIVAGDSIVPEYLQSEMNVDNLLKFCTTILTNDGERLEMVAALRSVRAKLGEAGAGDRAADLIFVELLS